MAELRERQTASAKSAAEPENSNSTAKVNGHEEEKEEKKKTNKPANTAFKQQRLPAWQPILTAGTVLPAFFIIGIIFVPLGALFLVTSNNVQEKEVDYTSCTFENTTTNETTTCKDLFDSQPNMGITCRCAVRFELDTAMEGEVYMLYKLTNYYQNHRRYVNSRDDLQLLGVEASQTDVSTDCKPYERRDVENANNGTDPIPVAPCGAIANSLFNDTFNITYLDDGNMFEPVLLNGSGIAWDSDRTTKFSNPPSFDGTTHPPNWQTSIQNVSGGYQNEDFIVWMRTAALPTFRKLHRKVVIQQGTVFDKGLPKGNYTLSIDYSYPVHMFDGTKSIVLTTTSWLGGKNSFLGIAYIVTGSLCILFGAFFLLIHIKHGHRPGQFAVEVSSDNNAPTVGAI
ncbi:cell cycle control protein 50A-like isoform X2 [Acanthaster planci]|uniref:Cell cycle control protein 50A-like isoform X2 n=1 Tax=Acanthaster planci TaxID=133434 RepID=A0A8B7Y8K7_ACAPL|nr:cell cycle control protein 50A-like isoform X2 [Acanthaster planci]